MNDTRIVPLLLVGGKGSHSVEEGIYQARQAAAYDLVETLLELPDVEHVVLATDDPDWVEGVRHLPVVVDVDDPSESFHFGRRLCDLIQRYTVDTVLYSGGGAAPLMPRVLWHEVAGRLLQSGRVVVTNNLHSSDWVAFRPAREVCTLVAAQERDNGLAWALAHEAGLPVHTLPPTAASRFDLDTPADLLIARAHPRVGRHLTAVLNKLDWSTDPVEGVLQAMAREGGHLAVIGRSSSAAWAALEAGTRCWTRLFVEERGMIASGRLSHGEVRSLLADYLEQVGLETFFGTLASLVEAVLFDTRVILGARGLWPTAADRFNADLMRWQDVEEPFLRAFSRAASEVNVPILMGGQSVVSGGLMALLEILAHRLEEG